MIEFLRQHALIGAAIGFASPYVFALAWLGFKYRRSLQLPGYGFTGNAHIIASSRPEYFMLRHRLQLEEGYPYEMHTTWVPLHRVLSHLDSQDVNQRQSLRLFIAAEDAHACYVPSPHYTNEDMIRLQLGRVGLAQSTLYVLPGNAYA
jgi:hypothetical protein